MKNTFIFLRHAKTVPDLDKHATKWSIDEKSHVELEKLSKETIFKKVELIYSSKEQKAIQTAKPFSETLNIEIQILQGLEELQRGASYLSKEDFEKLKRTKLEERDSSLDGGETANECLERFASTIKKIDSLHENKHILIVSHGTVLSLYFSHLKNDFSNIFEYWKNMPFCSVGIVEDSKILRDISRAN